MLEVRHLHKRFSTHDATGSWLAPSGGKATSAILESIDLSIGAGETLGLMGSSGCGKSTLAHILARVTDADSGSITFDGADIGSAQAKHAARAPWRGDIQLVFQDVRGSLDPLTPCGKIITASMRGRGIGQYIGRGIGRGAAPEGRDNLRSRAESLAKQVLLPLHLLDSLPHRLSGGEAARVNIARALASSPRLLILDEPTASLDLPVQAAILQMLADVRRRHNTAMLLISHDADVIRLMCERTLHLVTGKLVEVPSALGAESMAV